MSKIPMSSPISPVAQSMYFGKYIGEVTGIRRRRLRQEEVTGVTLDQEPGEECTVKQIQRRFFCRLYQLQWLRPDQNPFLSFPHFPRTYRWQAMSRANQCKQRILL